MPSSVPGRSGSRLRVARRGWYAGDEIMPALSQRRRRDSTALLRRDPPATSDHVAVIDDRGDDGMGLPETPLRRSRRALAGANESPRRLATN
jgi:hypothetical protein